MPKTPKLNFPKILKEKIIFKSRLFTIQTQQLKFSNGVEVNYERLLTSSGAVLIIPLLNSDTMLLIREYSTGVGRYELGFPKGKIDSGEKWKQAAARESKEEIGYEPKKLTLLDSVTLSAGYMQHKTDIVLAENLIPNKSLGDEPEPLEIVPWKIHDWKQLVSHKEFTEGRSYSAILLLLKNKKFIS